MKISNSKYGVIVTTPGLVIIIALVVFPLIILLVTLNLGTALFP